MALADARDRCERLTEMAGGAALARAVQRVLVEHASGVDRVLVWARKRSRLDRQQKKAGAKPTTTTSAAQSNTSTTAATTSTTAANANKSATEAANGDQVDAYDWSFFQGALEMLHAASDFSARLQALEASLHEQLTTAEQNASSAPRFAELSAFVSNLCLCVYVCVFVCLL